MEPRFKAAVLIVAGFYLQHSLPEVDAFNFAPRVRAPVLLLNGRFDFFYPIDTSQLPMFELFRSPEGQKRRVVYDTGHNIPRLDLIRESLDWLDKIPGESARVITRHGVAHQPLGAIGRCGSNWLASGTPRLESSI